MSKGILLKDSRRKLHVAVMTAAVVGMTGCGPSKIALRSDFWTSKPGTVGIAMVTPPAAGAHRAGAQGLLDLAINSAMANDLQKQLSRVDVNVFPGMASSLAQKFGQKGFQTKIISNQISLEDLPKFNGSHSQSAKRDFRGLADHEGIDLLFLVSIDQLGTIRHYYGFIPLDAPKGFCKMKGELIDLRNNQILWSQTQEEKKSTVNVQGQWDQPPAYPNLMAAVGKAIENGGAFVIDAFFKA